MPLQIDAKLLIEDTNMDRYIDDGMAQIEELTIGNFKIEIAGVAVLAATVLTGMVPKIADYAAKVYKDNFTDINDNVVKLTDHIRALSSDTGSISQISDKASELVNKVSFDTTKVSDALTDLIHANNSLMGDPTDVNNIIEKIQHALVRNNGNVPPQHDISSAIDSLQGMKEGIDEATADTLSDLKMNPEDYSDNAFNVIHKAQDILNKSLDKSIETVHQLGHDITQTNSLIEKGNKIISDVKLSEHAKVHDLATELQQINHVSFDIVLGIIFVSLTVIAVSIIRKIMKSRSEKSKSKKVTPRKLMSFMKSTKRIISKSFKKKH